MSYSFQLNDKVPQILIGLIPRVIIDTRLNLFVNFWCSIDLRLSYCETELNQYIKRSDTWTQTVSCQIILENHQKEQMAVWWHWFFTFSARRLGTFIKIIIFPDTATLEIALRLMTTWGKNFMHCYFLGCFYVMNTVPPPPLHSPHWKLKENKVCQKDLVCTGSILKR